MRIRIGGSFESLNFSSSCNNSEHTFKSRSSKTQSISQKQHALSPAALEDHRLGEMQDDHVEDRQ